MKLVFLGTTGYHPNDQRQTACLLIPSCGVMLDAGTGLYRAAGYLAIDTLDIFLTHAHLDHIVGLTYLFNLVHGRPLLRVRVHGEAEKLTAVEEHLFATAVFPKRPEMTMVPLTGPVPLAGNGRLTYFPLDHPGGGVGFRLDWPGHSMAYVTDTTAKVGADYLAAIRGVDLLVHECYFRDSESAWAETTRHSWTTAVAELARASGARRLLLVHINPLETGSDPVGIDTARALFPATDVAGDLMEVEF